MQTPSRIILHPWPTKQNTPDSARETLSTVPVDGMGALERAISRASYDACFKARCSDAKPAKRETAHSFPIRPPERTHRPGPDAFKRHHRILVTQPIADRLTFHVSHVLAKKLKGKVMRVCLRFIQRSWNLSNMSTVACCWSDAACLPACFLPLAGHCHLGSAYNERICLEHHLIIETVYLF